MSHWIEERRRDDERHAERNRKAEDYDRVAAELARLRLTDAEREVLTAAPDWLHCGISESEAITLTETLRGLLNRLSPIKTCDSDRPQPVESTPEPVATPGDGTEQRECTEPVAWQLVHECERLRDEVMMLRLTDAEREAVWALASHHLDDATFGKFAKTLCSLFERTNVTEYPRSKLLPTVMPDQLDAVIEGLERIKALEAEIARLRAAARAVLDGVNKRYPDKNPREWTCPHMAELDRLVQPEGGK